MKNKILSFDIGEITLAYCILISEGKSYNIIDWNLCSIRKTTKDTFTNKIDNLIELLKSLFPNDNNIDIILIEHQGDFRPFMKSIQMVIYTYFILQHKVVKMRHAIDKSKSDIIGDDIKNSIKSKNKYQKNKELSKKYIKSIIPEHYLNRFIKNNSCFDDYSDALFQAIDFINKVNI
jgi:hypothetical protein